MQRLVKHLCILATAVCVVGVQLHVASELDLCLWKSGQTQQIPGHGSGHGGSGHASHCCCPVSWALTTARSQPTLASRTSRLEIETLHLVSKLRVVEANSPRAPPRG